jgi:hypothetical protein
MTASATGEMPSYAASEILKITKHFSFYGSVASCRHYPSLKKTSFR